MCHDRRLLPRLPGGRAGHRSALSGLPLAAAELNLEIQTAERRMLEEVDTLWRTAPLRSEKPSPTDEVRSIMSVFDETLFTAENPEDVPEGEDFTQGLNPTSLEALRDCLRERRATVDELHRAAQARRMANVMRPYLEALA